jgi:hypothetical protein
MTESHRRTINGEEFEVGVETGVSNGNRYRRVYMYHVETAEEKGHSYMCADKKYFEKSRWIGKDSKIPPKSDHILEVVNKGASRWFQMQEKSQKLEDEIEAVMKAADEVYEDAIR